MRFAEKIIVFFLSLFLFLIVVHILAYSFVMPYRGFINEISFRQEAVDEETDYENRRMVEDTARAMISNYNSYKLEYEAYKTFPTDSQEYIRSTSAKIAANNIASTYNNYITQNNYVWKGNLPGDIPLFLPYLT